MNSKQAVKRMREIKKELYLFEFGTPTSPRNERVLSHLKQEAKKIYEKFADHEKAEVEN